jgi:hypothetical protein
MLLLHLVPVGLSLLDKGRLEFPGSAITAQQALQYAATGQRHELDWDRLGPAEFPRRLAAGFGTDTAAEWTSIAAIREESRYASAQGDAFAFIATDTDGGLRAATLVAERYRQSAIRYLDEPLTAGRNDVLEPGDVYVCRVPDLDLGRLSPTPATWRSLGAVGRLAANAATQTARGEWHVILHLSGGYKAMVPYLMVLAEAVQSRLRARSCVEMRAVALHESSLERDTILVDVPVRAVEGDLLDDVKKLSAAARLDSELVAAGVGEQLLGLFTERHSSGYHRLTDPGLITVTVL